jgi:hypothetical protein
VDAVIVDLLFSTDLSTREIALRVGATHEQVKGRIAALGLSWVRAHERMSRGHHALFTIMQKLVPGEDVITEQPIGERLKLDVYCPKYRLAAEYHGQQHFQYVEHFHGDMEGYRDSMRRDARKIEICKEKGIALVAFDARDPMTEDYVFQQLLEALVKTQPSKTLVQSVRKPKSDWELAQAEKQRERRKQTYRRIKQEKKL